MGTTGAGPVPRLLVSHALAAVGMSLPWPLFLVLVWDRAGNGPHGDLLIGLTGAARMLPYVALSWAAGVLADRFRRDRLVRATLLARLVLLAVGAVALAQDRLLMAVVATALAVACGTPAYPALAAALPGVAGDERRRATGLLVTIEVASFVVGPALGGLLLAGAARVWVPALAVLATALALVPMTGVRLPAPTPAPGPGPVTRPRERPASRSPLAALTAAPAAVRAVAVAGLINAVGAAVALALLPVAEEVWSGGGAGYGLAAAMFGFGALAAPALWWLGGSAGGRARLGLGLLGVSLLGVPLAPGVAWAVLPLVVAGAATVHVEGAVTETIQDAVPDGQRASVLGLTDSVMVGAALLASLLAPWLSSALGARELLALLAGLCVVAVLLPARGATPAPVAVLELLEVMDRAVPMPAYVPGIPAQRQPPAERPARLSGPGPGAPEPAPDGPRRPVRSWCAAAPPG